MPSVRGIRAGAAYIELYARDNRLVRGLKRAQKRLELETEPGMLQELALLQMRPMVVAHEHFEFDLDEIDPDDVVCACDRTFGNGRIAGIRDILLVDPAKFERARSRETATALAEMNASLQREKRPYLLIGPGRWGSNDPWLGIPVEWSQISGASVLVETGFKKFHVKPSEGSHFFHNMTSFHVAYFTLNPQEGEGILDLSWLRQQHVLVQKENGLIHLQLDEPVLALLDGKNARGAVVKPGAKIP